MPIPSAMVTRFFHFLVNRHFADAKRELERIEEKMHKSSDKAHKSEWNRGYFRALFGMLVEQRSNNGEYAFISQLDFTDMKALKGYRKEFQAHVQNRLHEDFDRGYFSAWAECMRVLSKLQVDNPSKDSTKDEGQARIESFLK